MHSHFLIIFLIVLTVKTDPQPIGGKSCTVDTDCGGVNAGICIFNQTQNQTGSCMCPQNLGNPDCSYIRINRYVAGGLEFLCFVGIGGVGEFILGRYGYAVGQLILLFAYLGSVVALCIVLCSMLCGRKASIVGGIFSYIIVIMTICFTFAGWIWCIVDAIYILDGSVIDGNGYTTTA